MARETSAYAQKIPEIRKKSTGENHRQQIKTEIERLLNHVAHTHSTAIVRSLPLCHIVFIIGEIASSAQCTEQTIFPRILFANLYISVKPWWGPSEAEEGDGKYSGPLFSRTNHSMDFSDSAISTFRSLGRMKHVISNVNSMVSAKENP